MLDDKYSAVPRQKDNILDLTMLYLSKMDLANLSEEEFVLKYADTYLKIKSAFKALPTPKGKFRDDINI